MSSVRGGLVLPALIFVSILQEQDQGPRDGAGDGIVNVIDPDQADQVATVGVLEGTALAENVAVGVVAEANELSGVKADDPSTAGPAPETTGWQVSLPRIAWKLNAEIVALVAWFVWMIYLIRENDTWLSWIPKVM